MEQINKIIFLDIDGVINHTAWYNWVRQHPEFLKDGGHKNIDPKSVEKIINICNQANAYIILSSSWRWHNFEQTIKKLSSIRDLRPILDRMVGVTLRTDERERGKEIKYFLNDCRKNHFNSEFNTWNPLIKSKIKISNFPKFVILDDDNFDILEEQLPFFIHVNDKVGITDEDIDKAVKILNESD